MMEQFWDIRRVAEYLGVTERTVYNRVRSGELPAVRVGRLWRVRPADIEAWLSRENSAADSAAARHGAAPRWSIYASPPDSGPLLVREGGEIPARADLEQLLAPVAESLDRRLAFVGLLSWAVQQLGWPSPVVVGGHAVEYYTGGDYPTVDIDLAGASEPIAQVLGAWGFAREGRHWYDDELRLLLEVPSTRPNAEALSHVVSVRIGPVVAQVLGPEDVIVDRLCAAKHWNDDESRLWAATMYESAEEIDREYLLRRAAEEDILDEVHQLLGGQQ
jgi:excisionase family DNA binding protein